MCVCFFVVVFSLHSYVQSIRVLFATTKGGAVDMLQRYIARRDQERMDFKESSCQHPDPKRRAVAFPGPGEHALYTFIALCAL